MSVLHVKGAAKNDFLPKTASTAIAINSFLTFDGSGGLSPAVAASARIAGVSLKKVAATDSDYAANTLIPVVIPTPESEFEVDVETGTLTTAMIGNQYDLASATGIDVTATSHKQVTVTGFISATKALVKINAAYEYADGA